MPITLKSAPIHVKNNGEYIQLDVLSNDTVKEIKQLKADIDNKATELENLATSTEDNIRSLEQDVVNLKDEAEDSIDNFLEEINDLNELEGWIAGNITTNEDNVDINNIKNPTTWRHLIQNCQEDDFFTISVIGGNGPRAWCFVNKKYEVLSRADPVVSPQNQVIIAPKNSTYLIVNDNHPINASDFGTSIVYSGGPFKAKLNLLQKKTHQFIEYIDYSKSNWENTEFPRSGLISDLLKTEKTLCIHHDNFNRDDANDIGNNGGSYNGIEAPMAYNEMSYTTGTHQINAIISNNKLCGIAEGSPTPREDGTLMPSVERVLKYIDTQYLPYKITTSTYPDKIYTGTDKSSHYYARIAVDIYDAQNYIEITVYNDRVRIERIGKKPLYDSIHANSINVYMHKLNSSDTSIYVYKDKINIYVCEKLIASLPATIQNTLCGLCIRDLNLTEPDLNTIINSQDSIIDSMSVRTFNVFLPDVFESNYIDNGIEYSNTTDFTEIGPIYTPYTALNIPSTDNHSEVTLETNQVNMSNKSLKFILDPAGANNDPSDSSEFKNAISHAELGLTNPKATRGIRSNLQTKIFDFDVYLPSDFVVNNPGGIFLQLQNYSEDRENIESTEETEYSLILNPSISLDIKDSVLSLVIRYYESKKEQGATANFTKIELFGGNGQENVPTNKWTHFTIYIKEGYIKEHHPIVAVWINGELKVYHTDPNTYNRIYGHFARTGIYQYSWKETLPDPTELDKILYIDNLYVWQ